MGEDDWDKGRLIRVPEKLWDDFAEACADQGLQRAQVLRAYMRRYVAAWKGRQGSRGPDVPPDTR
jgi:hypothetical protein